MAEPMFCKGCASIIGDLDTFVRCGACLECFHINCYRWRHGCHMEGVEIDDD